MLDALGVPLSSELLTRALTHRSYTEETGEHLSNDRLEFLGDAMLGAVVTDHLYRTNPDVSERGLAKLRAGVVNMNALAEVARGLGTDGLGPHLLMGEHEEASGGRDKSSVLADALEALVGAVYVEHGIDATSAVVHRLFDPRMAEVSAGGGLVDWKTRLYELTDTMDLSPPEYLVDSGDREYTATVMVAGRSYGPEIGRTKREAEQNAAKTAYRELSP
ncbi:ribonuclease III [Kibdelosporangium aridum]|uniref:Ribonuclease 3 n=1 Tax=Kibdelosporangium aridum TaxID=2030 RepID=A0A428ZEK4_KIBAR|nr:ribonuclease III [Kibdelosporangium aridum]RSM86411.1 ribonuclease III [Kibdelosporangium aridum]